MITVYGMDCCSRCRQLVSDLKKHGIKFEYSKEPRPGERPQIFVAETRMWLIGRQECYDWLHYMYKMPMPREEK